MTLFLTEHEVLELFPMEKALERVEASFHAQQRAEAVNRSRERLLLPHLSLHYMAAAIPEEKILGMKIYTVSRKAFRFLEGLPVLGFAFRFRKRQPAGVD